MKPGYECEVIEPSQKTKNKVTLYHFTISFVYVAVFTETGSLPVSILPVVMSYVLRVCTLSADEFFYLVFGQPCGLRDHGDIHAHRE